VLEHEIVIGGGTPIPSIGTGPITQGWYNLVNDFLYLDPDEYQDIVLQDQGLVADPVDPTVLRRQYLYPGLLFGSTVRVTGKKRYIPITSNSDYLICQNIEALKRMIISIERFENNAPDEGEKYQQAALALLQAEVKQHIMDPINVSKRLANYDQDEQNFPYESMGWTRAVIAREVPGAAFRGKSSLGWYVNTAERRLFQKGLWKGTLQKIDAYIMGGFVYFPPYVQTVLAIDMGQEPLDIRSTFIEYMKNGPAKASVHRVLIDRGDVFFPSDGTTRRKYKLVSDAINTDIMSTICKLRWVPKSPADMMVIRNYEALRLMVNAIMSEHEAGNLRKQNKIQEAQAEDQNAALNEQKAVDVLDKELREYLGGVMHTVRVQTYGFGLGSVGQCTL
jgi:hypothetical protein